MQPAADGGLAGWLRQGGRNDLKGHSPRRDRLQPQRQRAAVHHGGSGEAQYSVDSGNQSRGARLCAQCPNNALLFGGKVEYANDWGKAYLGRV